jgi:phage terminase Nu1 subunit (DNA packaging protein)
MAKDSTVTAAILADWLGLTDRQVYLLKAKGVLTTDGNKFPLQESVRAYCRHMSALANRRGETTGALTRERERETRERADKIAMQNAERRRELVPSKEVEAQWASILRDVRARMLALPARIGQRLGHLTAHDLSEIDRETRDALAEAADDGI